MGLIILEILASLIVLIAIILLVLKVNGTCHRKYEEAESILDSWMIMLDDDVPINKIAIPGSHDAATSGVVWAAETQNCTIKEQLLLGTRYFDLRVHKKGDDFVVFHSVVDGMNFVPVLQDIKEFIYQHPTEFLILDFQHFKGDSQDGVLKLLLDSLYDDGLILENTTDMSDVEFIRNQKLGDVRGKCIVFWGDKSAAKSKCLFFRNDNECTFEGACLDSYYIADLHKSDFNCLVEKAHPAYFNRVRKNGNKNKNAIFVLQCQFTDKYFVRGPWSREKTYETQMNNYITSLGSHKQFDDVNVIMRDFINAQKCKDIINLNAKKGIMRIEL